MGPPAARNRSPRSAGDQHRAYAISKIRDKGLKDVALESGEIATNKCLAVEGHTFAQGHVPIAGQASDFQVNVARCKSDKRATERGAMVWLVGLNPGALEVVRNSGLDERLGRERMLFNARAAIERYQTLCRNPGAIPMSRLV